MCAVFAAFLVLIFFQRARSLAAPLARSRKALTLTGSVGDVDPVALSSEGPLRATGSGAVRSRLLAPAGRSSKTLRGRKGSGFGPSLHKVDVTDMQKEGASPVGAAAPAFHSDAISRETLPSTPQSWERGANILYNTAASQRLVVAVQSRMQQRHAVVAQRRAPQLQPPVTLVDYTTPSTERQESRTSSSSGTLERSLPVARESSLRPLPRRALLLLPRSPAPPSLMSLMSSRASIAQTGSPQTRLVVVRRSTASAAKAWPGRSARVVSADAQLPRDSDGSKN